MTQTTTTKTTPFRRFFPQPVHRDSMSLTHCVLCNGLRVFRGTQSGHANEKQCTGCAKEGRVHSVVIGGLFG